MALSAISGVYPVRSLAIDNLLSKTKPKANSLIKLCVTADLVELLTGLTKSKQFDIIISNLKYPKSPINL